MRFYSTEQLGPKQATLPSGALLCRDTVIARLGWQDYLADEIGAKDDGPMQVMRDAEDVFSDDAMASLESVPVTLSHPTLYRHISENDAIRGVRTGIPTGDRAAMARLMRTRDEQRQHAARHCPAQSRLLESPCQWLTLLK
jgi:hypothetical protein